MKEVQWRSYWKINCKQVVWVAAAAQQLNDYSKILIGKICFIKLFVSICLQCYTGAMPLKFSELLIFV